MIDPPTASAGYQATDLASAKYTREMLLEIGRASVSRQHDVDIDTLTMPGFSRGGQVNGNSSRGWGKTNDANAHNDPRICWNDEGSCGPLGLRALSAEEKEVGTSVYKSPVLHCAAWKCHPAPCAPSVPLIPPPLVSAVLLTYAFCLLSLRRPFLQM